MKKELLNCINNNIKRTRKAQEAHERKSKIIAENQKLIDNYWRDYYMRQISNFFRNFIPDRSLRFPLYGRRRISMDDYNNNIDRKLIMNADFSSKYDVIVDFVIPEFKYIGFSELEIGYDVQENKLHIRGMVPAYSRLLHKHEYWGMEGRWVDYERWSIPSLELFVLALPWIEDYIAKEYGCSNAR